MVLGDIQIRQRLCQDLLDIYQHDPETILLHELSVCHGQARVDIAVINGTINGYEIKSDKDTLGRLPGQIEVYNRVFDTMTLVVGESLCEEAVRLVPRWWGVKLVTGSSESQIRVEDIQEPEQNQEVDAFSLAQILWKDELVRIIELEGADKRLRHQPRFQLWAYVANNLPLERLQCYVRYFVRHRPLTWRPDALRTSSDG